MAKAKITEAEITDLKFDDKNFNKGSEFGGSLMTKSFEKFGAARGILVDKNNNIIAGNKSTEKFGEQGGKKILIVETTGDTLVVTKRTDIDLNTPQGRELALADNATAKANIIWDAEILEAEVSDAVCEEWGVELPKEEPEAVEDDFNGTAPKEAITVLGDLYEIGEHRLLCGDSTCSDTVSNLMDGQLADLYITDPPYGVSYTGRTKDKLTIKNDSLSSEQTHQLWEDTLNNIFIFLKDGGAIYATVPAGLLQVGFMQKMLDLDCLRQCMLWNKGQMVLGHSDYHYQHEPILYGWKPGGSHYFINDRTKTTVLDFKKPIRNAEHPTMKPIELWSELIQNSSKQKENILDSFLGSGTTMVASHQLKRKCFGMELDPKYCDVIVARMTKLFQSSETDKAVPIKRNGQSCSNQAKRTSFVQRTTATISYQYLLN